MEAAFDFSDDEESGNVVDGDRRGLLSDGRKKEEEAEVTKEIKGVFDDPLRKGEEVAYDMNGDIVESTRIPGSYDFEREYVGAVRRIESQRTKFTANLQIVFIQPTNHFIPPSSSPPPFQPYSRHHPAPNNSNGIIPSTLPSIPGPRSRYGLLGSMLPSYFNRGSAHSTANVGGGVTGVFANLAARPEVGRRPPAPGEQEGAEWVPEDSQKEGPPVSVGWMFQVEH